ncbi:MAG: hypothetical protein Q3961_05110, partial [Bifidobacteriaceae bacterium]|nr:hypothetical protein [Bifidobacteriaceae bacterium]
ILSKTPSDTLEDTSGYYYGVKNVLKDVHALIIVNNVAKDTQTVKNMGYEASSPTYTVDDGTSEQLSTTSTILTKSDYDALPAR